MTNTIHPVEFKGRIPFSTAYRIPERIDEQLIQNILNGTVNVNDVMNLPPFERSEEILAAGAMAIEKLGTEQAASSFLDAVRHLNVNLNMDNGKGSSCEERWPALLGSHAKFDSALKTGFSNIAKQMQNSAGKLAPQNWGDLLTDDLCDAGFTLGQDLARQCVLPLVLSIAKANRNTRNRSDSNSIASNLYDLSTKEPSDLVKMIDAFPAVALYLSAPWRDTENTKLTEKLAKQALHLIEGGIQNDLAVENKEKLLRHCSLSWLSCEQVSEQINQPHDLHPERFHEFSTATAEQFCKLVVRLMTANNNYWDSTELRNLPVFDKYACDPCAIKPLFQISLLPTNDDVYMERSMTFLRAIAEAQPDGKTGQALLHGALQASFAEFESTTDLDFKKSMAHNLIFEISMNTLGNQISEHPSDKNFKVIADTQVLSALIKGVDMGQFLDDHRKSITDTYIRERVEYGGVSKEDQAIMQNAFIESGAISLGSLRRKDLTAKLMGSTLEKNPQRLTEVTHFNDFMKLAKMYKIPVNISSEIQEIFRRSSKAIKAIDAADPMAELDAKKPVKKRITI